MNDIGIFMFGCIVFGVTIASSFVAVIASDHPEREEPASRSSPAAANREYQDAE